MECVVQSYASLHCNILLTYIKPTRCLKMEQLSEALHLTELNMSERSSDVGR